VQDRVGEHGRERTALGSALLGMGEHRALQHPSPKDRPDQLQHPPVADPLPHTVEHQVKPESIEEAFDVGVHHPGPPTPHRPANRLQGLVRAAPGPKPKRAGQKVGLQDRLEHDPQGRLDHPITHARDPERTKPWRLGRARLGDPDPPHRLRTIGPVPQRRLQLVKELLDPGGLDLGDGDGVGTGGAPVGADFLPCPPENVPAVDPVIQGMEPSVRRPLGRPVQRSLQLSGLVEGVVGPCGHAPTFP
jgi:hypothetical protein